MKCLYKLNWQDLQTLVEDELKLGEWYVPADEELYHRMERIKTFDTDKSYNVSYMQHRYETIKQQADNSGIKYNEVEIATWFDTLSILYHAFSLIEYDYLRDNIVLLQEYNIPFSNKRADYVLCYDNKILILEFSFRKLGYELQYETKLHQAIGYKELISNVLPKEVDVATYTFLVDAGYICENSNVYDLANYIEKFFNKNIDLALRSLSHLDDNELENDLEDIDEENSEDSE